MKKAPKQTAALKNLLSELAAMDKWMLGDMKMVRVTWSQLDMVKKHYPDCIQDIDSISISINGKNVKLIKVGA